MRRLVKIKPPPNDDTGVNHINRYMTDTGFAFACGKCGFVDQVPMPANDLAPRFNAFLSAHQHKELS
jgi:hypothetical protein